MSEIIENNSVDNGLAREILSILIDRQWQLATAESLTGGMIASTITSIAGASEVFKGAVVSYQNAVKNSVLGVSNNRLRDYGAVDSVVAEQMSQGVISLLNADVAVSVTGVAGPGPAEGKTPGSVWINVTTPCGSATVDYQFEGERAEVRQATVIAALKLVLESIKMAD